MKSALIFSALFLLKAFAFGQDDVLELLPGSNSLEFDNKTGVHRLLGNVNFKYQGYIMFCDSAHYHEKKRIVRAYGNVHMNKKDTLNLYCDSLVYSGRTKKSTLWGHVRARDNEYKLTCDTLHYDAKKSQAWYKNGGKVQSINSNQVLTSKVGYFHPDSKNFFFSNDVVYNSPEMKMTTDTLRYLYGQKTAFFQGPTNIEAKDANMYCETGWYNTGTDEGSLQRNAWISRDSDYIAGDTLLYMPKQGQYIGKGNVYYMDSVQKMSFEGDYAFSSDSLEYSFLTGNAVATKHMDSDTIYIHADTLYNYKEMNEDDSTKMDVLKAYNGAKLYSSNFQCQADSMIYSKSKNKIELFYSPIVWSKSAELKGDFMDIDLNDSIVEHVNIYENSTILMKVEPELYYNQIAGKIIRADFRDNDLYQAKVTGNAMTVSFPEDKEVKDSTQTITRMGMNRLYSSHLRIDIDSNEIVGITYIEKPDGAFYPMNQLVKEEQFVPGFEWKDALRPKSKEDLLKEEEEEITLEKAEL